MYSFGICIFVTALLLPCVEARSGTSGGFHFDAPPLEDVTLAIVALLLVATSVQLGIAASYFLSARSGHHLPGVGTVLALVFLALGYALRVAAGVEAWSANDSGEVGVSALAISNIQTAMSFFWNCADAMVFAAVALLLRDRHLTHVKSTKGTPGRATSLLPWTIVAFILFAVVFIMVTVNVALVGTAFNALYNEHSTIHDLSARVYTANCVFFTFIAVDSLATLYLIAFGTVVKRLTKTDKITTLTLRIIMPLLTFLIIFRIVFAILSARLSRSASSTLETGQALDLSSTILYGLLHLAVATMLVYFLMIPGLWDGTRAGAGTSGYNMSQDGPGPHAGSGNQPKALDRNIAPICKLRTDTTAPNVVKVQSH